MTNTNKAKPDATQAGTTRPAATVTETFEPLQQRAIAAAQIKDLMAE